MGERANFMKERDPDACRRIVGLLREYRAVNGPANGVKPKGKKPYLKREPATEILGTFMTKKQLAAQFGCCERRIDMLRKEGLPTYKRGHLILFDKISVAEWLRQNQVTGNPRRTPRRTPRARNGTGKGASQ